MKKIITLLKGSPIAMVVVGLIVAGVASAAILAVYTTMIGQGTVEQSVVFGNGEVHKDYVIANSDAIAGNTYTQDYNLMNKSETTAPIEFVTNECIVGGGNCVDFDDASFGHHEEGVETSYWSTVELRPKDADWRIIPGKATATLTYELAAPTFNYEFEATGLTEGENYSLIYYADKADRYNDWGGNNPGAFIAEFIADEKGNIYAEGTETEPVKGRVNLGMNLPAPEDWNASAEANYCDEDGYDLCRGAKIWLVLTDDYNETTKKLENWNQADYLFETDLITYHDSNITTGGLNLGEGKLNFFVKNVLDVALAPGKYKISTKVVPVPVTE